MICWLSNPFKLIPAGKIITVSIIFIAISAGHIQMITVSGKLFSNCFGTGIKEFAGKQSNI